MSSSVIIGDAALKDLWKRAQQVLKNPKTMLQQINIQVLKPGYEMQFRTKGRRWSGSEWQERSGKTKAVRKAQGKDPNTTLIASGNTMRRWIAEPKNGSWKNGMVVGSPFAHVVDLQDGKTGKFTVSYNVKGATWNVPYNGIPARQIQPVNGLNTDEMSTIESIVRNFIERELG